jgi:hypothetical protein
MILPINTIRNFHFLIKLHPTLKLKLARMKKTLLSILFSYCLSLAMAQSKKPLDHTVYDQWKSLGERLISKDGNYVAYTVNPQEGDGELVIQNPQSGYKKIIARGYSVVISNDSKYLFCKIKAPFQDTRQARIKKKKADDMPKDSIAIVELGTDSVWKKSRIKSFKIPEKGGSLAAILLEKKLADPEKRKPKIDTLTNSDKLLKLADSIIRKSIDSIKGEISQDQLLAISKKAANEIIRQKNKDNEWVTDAEGDDNASGSGSGGTELMLWQPEQKKPINFTSVNNYLFDKFGKYLLIETGKIPKDSLSKASLQF